MHIRSWLMILLTGTSSCLASNITWIAQTPDNDMEDSSNWNPASVPGSGDNAIFNSTLPNISLNPTDSTAPFSVANFQFTSQASPFTFTFNNQQLTFAGTGITGSNTNTAINSVFSNTNGSYQILFQGAISSSGNAILSAINTGTSPGTGVSASQIQADAALSVGNQGSFTLSNIGSDDTGATSVFVGLMTTAQFNQVGAFQAGDNLTIQATQEGTISGSNGGDNRIGAILGGPQVALNDTVTIGNNAQITVSNEGTAGGTNSGGQNFVGYKNERQFFAGGIFQAGDNLTLIATNTGFDNSTGNNIVSAIDGTSGDRGNQIEFFTNCLVGNNATMSATNSGTCAGTSMTAGSSVSSMNCAQYNFKGTFTALDNLNIMASNIGVDSSIGVGGNVAGALSAPQLFFEDDCTVGNNASISIANSGTFTGQSTGMAYNAAGGLGAGQMQIDGRFRTGDDFHLTVTNEGNNSGSATQQNYIANSLAGTPIAFNSTTSLGDNATIEIGNQATNSTTSSTQAYVGSFIAGYQFHSVGAFEAGDNFNFTYENSGQDTSVGDSQSFVGAFNAGVQFDSRLNVGNNSSISISNSGSYAGSNTTGGAHVAFVAAGPQFVVAEDFIAGDGLNFHVKNSATDSSVGFGSDGVASLQQQVTFGASCSVGDNGTFTISNQGSYTGENSTDSNRVAPIFGSQVACASSFTAGNGLNFGIENIGNCNTTGNTNYVAPLSNSQLLFSSDVDLGDNCSFSIKNQGTNQGPGIFSTVACLNNTQAVFSDTVTSGSQLSITVSNNGINSGDINNCVANISGSQLSFQQSFVTGDGSSLSISNSGSFSGIDSGNSGGGLATLDVGQSQLKVSESFQAGDDFILNITNGGEDSGSGVGSRFIGTLDSQVNFLGNCNLGDRASLNMTNTGNYSGTNTTTGNKIGVATNQQFSYGGTLTAGDDFTLQIRNSGTSNTTGQSNEVASLAASQLAIVNSVNLGNQGSFIVANSGTHQGTGTLNDVACIADTQVVISNPITAGIGLSFDVSNTGINSGDINNCVANITGSQLLFQQPLRLQNGSSVSVSNSGTFSGFDNGSTGGSVASFQNQFHVPAPFQTGNVFELNIANSGTDSGSGAGSRLIGSIDAQASFSGSCTFGDSASMSVSNSGNYTGTNSTTGNEIGYVTNQQFSCPGALTAGNDFDLVIRNSGTSNTNGQNNQVGSMAGPQLAVGNIFAIGDQGNIVVANVGTHQGTGTLNHVGCVENSQAPFPQNFTSGSQLSMNVSNSGNNSGDINNCVGTIAGSQLLFQQGMTTEKNSSITVTNSGTFSGFDNGNTGGDVAAFEKQLEVTGAFQAGKNFGLNLSNSGTDSGSGVGNRSIGSIDAQGSFLGNFNVGDKGLMSVTNKGSYTGANSTTGNTIGDVLNSQFFCAGTLTGGDDFHLSITNQGNCQTAGGSNQVGTVGASQLMTGGTFTIGKHGKITLNNKGKNGGTGALNHVGSIDGDQMQVNGSFEAGKHFKLQATNKGKDTGSGAAQHIVGAVTNQVDLLGTATFGKKSSIHVKNTGKYSGSNTILANEIANIANHQISFAETLKGENTFDVQVMNKGLNHTDGHNNKVSVLRGSQLFVGGSSNLGKDSTMAFVNEGIHGNKGTLNQVACIEGAQGRFEGDFSAGSEFQLLALNKGTSHQGDDNTVGTIGDQIQFSSKTSIGKESYIAVKNKGKNSGGSEGSVANIANSQLSILDHLNAGKKFQMEIVNSGDCEIHGDKNNVGNIGSSQLHLEGKSSLGKKSVILVENRGKFDGSGKKNQVACVDNSQVLIEKKFSTDESFKMTVVNQAINHENSTNHVAWVNGSQIEFQELFSMTNDSLLTAFNSGNIADSQILFDGGFELLNGRGTLAVVNQGTVGDAGITIKGKGLGGDVNIVLDNSSMKINTKTDYFIIGALNGNEKSFVQSKPMLMIDTDPDVTANFAGDIQNFASKHSSLTKKGMGAQILSGKNTFTGSTNIQEGNLVLTGSVAGDVNIYSAGTLKGTGTIGKKLLNEGTVSPGLSIGTLTVLGDFVNKDGGLYDVEINAKGESDLIEVRKTARIEGGTVKVEMIDPLYLFQNPYTIIHASKVKGEFSNIDAEVSSPLVVPTLQYDSQHVYYVIQQDIEKAAKTHNQTAVAKQLDSIRHPTEQQNLLLNEMVGLTFPKVRESLDSMSGYQHVDDLWISQMVSNQFLRRLYDPIRPILADPYPCCHSTCSQWTGWIEGEGGEMHLKGSHNEHGVKITNYEIMGGLQKTFFRSLTLGIAGGYQHNHLDYHHAGSGKGNIGMGGLYALYRPTFFYGLAEFTYSYSSNKLKRHIHIGEIHDTAKSEPKISQFGFYGEVGCDLFANRFLFQPFVGIQTGNFCRHHVKEHDNNWNLGLDIDKKEWDTTTSRLGLHFTTPQEECVKVSFDVAWNYLFSKREEKMRGHFLAFGKEYSIKGTPLERNSVDFAATLINQLEESLYFYLEVSGQWWNKAHSVDVTGGIEFSW